MANYKQTKGNCEWCGAHKDNIYGLCSRCGRFPSCNPVIKVGKKEIKMGYTAGDYDELYAKLMDELPEEAKSMKQLDLLSVIGEVDMTGYCNQASKPYYWDWEEKIANKALLKLGYKPCTPGWLNEIKVLLQFEWYNNETDSFGPLGRSTWALNPNGERVELYYG